MLTFALFPSGFASSTLDIAGEVGTAYSPVIILVVGFLLAVLAIVALINAMKHH